MIDLEPEVIAAAGGGRLLAGEGSSSDPEDHPVKAVVDSREVEPGDLFVGIAGANVDGGDFALEALRGGAWGVMVDGRHAEDVRQERVSGRVIAVDDPLAALAGLASEWRTALGDGACRVVGITGSVGKTTTKDILRELLGRFVKVHASPENFNTEVGLPLAILQAGADTECLVLEMAMRGRGQIRRLARIARPEIGLVTNVGAVHIELIGSLEAVAEAKAELIAELPPEGVCVVPVEAEMLRPHLRAEIRTVTFADDSRHRDGRGVERSVEVARGTADVRLVKCDIEDGGSVAVFKVGERELELSFNFNQHHYLVNATAAMAVVSSLGLPLNDLADNRVEVEFSKLRGEQFELSGGSVVINDCYNANPMSMHAAIDHLVDVAGRRGSGRRVAVLGEMAELGPRSAELHQSVGRYAAEQGVDVLIGVGKNSSDYADGFGDGTEVQLMRDTEEAASKLPGLLEDNDAVLIKGSRSVGLERVARELA